MKKQMNRPLFITFEGGEGAGKTTLVEKIAADLTERGFTVVKTREPGGSNLGEYIRQWLLNHDFSIKVGKRAELMLFLASRAQHLEEFILPSLAKGHIVLCDRFNDSSVVYQGVARGLGADVVGQFCDLLCQGVTPSITFYLDVDPKIGLKRTQKIQKETASEGKLDKIEAEKLEFHQQVQDGFRHLAKEYPGRIRQLNANLSLEEVFIEAKKGLDECLKLHGM
jgi:dTMP kinase